MEKKLILLDIVEDTAVDGPGFRTAVYAAGCRHACPGCHNPESWSFRNGREVEIEDIAEQILSDPFAHVTFTGGDPMYQPEAFAQLARIIRKKSHKNIWCYTGFLFEELLENESQKALLREIDVLVDGPFIQALRKEELPFRGSSNQRLIDVPASLKAGQTILFDYQPFPTT